MARLFESVPNCSEGRDKEIIEYIADAVRSVPGVALMDYSSDENHNRSVYTIVGDPDQMGEAAFRFAKACVEKIDMTKHHGKKQQNKNQKKKNRRGQTSRRTSAYGRCRRNPVHSC